MTDDGVHVGDVGVVFVATVFNTATPTEVIDLSAATLMQFTFARPDGSELVVHAAWTTDGTDGQMQYATAAGDLNAAGRWKMQGFVEVPGGEYHTSTYAFKVFSNLGG